MEISKMTDIALIKRYLVKLEAHFSNGGINCGRSINSILLDGIFELLKTDNSAEFCEEISEKELEEEIERRLNYKIVFSEQKSFSGVQFLVNIELARYLMVKLNQFQLFESLIGEPIHFKVMINLVCLLFCSDLVCINYEREDLIEEVRQRSWEYFHYHNDNLCGYFAYPTFDPEF